MHRVLKDLPALHRLERRPVHHAAQAVLGHKAVFHRQRAAQTAVDAGQPLKIGQVAEARVLDGLQHVHHVLDAVHAQRALDAHGLRLTAGHRPLDANHARAVDLQRRKALLEEHAHLRVHVLDRDHAVDVGLGEARRRADRRHLRRAGRDEERAHIGDIHAVLLCIFLLGDLGRRLHGRNEVDHVVQQRREIDLNQPHDGRAGGGDHGLGPVLLAHRAADRIGDDLRAARDLKHIDKAQPEQRRDDRLRLMHALELRVQRRRGQRNRVFEAPDGIQRIGHGHLGMAFADLDALAAVDAALRKDRRLVVSDSDGLRRTSLQTRRAALAFVLVKPHGMIVGFLQCTSPPACMARQQAIQI